MAAEASALGLAALPLPFAALPPALTLRIFLAVPVTWRLRCREVSRAWRDALSGERALWTHLDLSEAGGVVGGVRAWPALLEAAAARAHDSLVSLDLSQWVRLRDVSFEAVVAVCAAAGRTLRELRLESFFLNGEELGALLGAAPSLQLLETRGTFDNAPEACHVLRREGHFAPVRLLEVSLRGALDDERLLEFTAACGAHASLLHLHLHGVLSGSRAALEAVVDAAIAAQVEELGLFGGWGHSDVNAASAPALARLLLNSTWLTSLTVYDQYEEPLADTPAAQAVGAALRANRTLRSLRLDWVDLWRDMAVAEALLSAAVGHPSLESVSLLNEMHVADAAAAGAMLAALVAANAPSLRYLCIWQVALGDAGLRPLVDALPHNTHLTALVIHECGMSDDFASGPLLDALRANASLRNLHTNFGAAAAAEELVAARNAAS